MSARPLRIVLAGELASAARQGGATWAVLQWALGLRALGHDVFVVQPAAPGVQRTFASVVAAHGLAPQAALVGPDRIASGPGYATVAEFAAHADLLLDLAGVLRDAELRDAPRVRAYVDLDPGFTQVWHAQGVEVGLDGHDRFVTVGLAVGAAACTVPSLGRRWTTCPPPVVLDHWTPLPDTTWRATTVANWRSYGTLDADGTRLGLKAHSWRALLPAGSTSALPLAPAIAIHPGDDADREALVANGWTVLDPRRHAGTPSAYRSFVRTSAAEVAVAKEGYVVTRSGWLSERSAAYLAAGRPVVAQDTGFGAALPTGSGLHAFTDAEGLVDATARVVRDYPAERRAARRIACEHLASDRVLPALLDDLEVAA